MSRDQGTRAVTVPTVAAGTTLPIINSACRLYGWSLTDAGSGLSASTALAAFVAAGNGTATLAPGAALTGLTITWGTFTVASVVQVTVTGAAGGTITFDLGLAPATTVPGVFSPPFPQPLQPANPAVGIAVTWTGNANSPAGHITAFSQSFQTAGQVLDGGQIIGTSTPIAGASDTQWLSDTGIYIGTSVSIKCVSGSISGCIYVQDGTDLPSDAY